MRSDSVCEVARQALAVHGVVPVALKVFAVETKRKADVAWDAASEAGARGDALTEAWERATAHAYCDVLGDQSWLYTMGVMDV